MLLIKEEISSAKMGIAPRWTCEAGKKAIS